MANIFFISDSHFSHENVWAKFKLADGCTPLRPFKSTQEMDETMVSRWNAVVSPKDKVYHLGDVTMSTKANALDIFYRLNGEKILIKGNHDILPLNKYAEHFKDVRGTHQFKGLIMSHIPIHPESLGRWGFNVHGHLHAHNVLDSSGNPDPRYFCVSVEQINYTPISLDEVLSHRP